MYTSLKKSKIYSLTLPPEQHETLDCITRKLGYTRNQLLKVAIELLIEKFKKSGKIIDV